MQQDEICPCSVLCPLQRAMEAIGGRWKLSVLCSLSVGGPKRYNELKRALGSISNTMLAKTLKELERDGLVKRTEYLEVPVRVVYETTPAVDKLNAIMVDLANWGMGLDDEKGDARGGQVAQ